MLRLDTASRYNYQEWLLVASYKIRIYALHFKLLHKLRRVS
jgi:hypothetical protein